MVEEKARQLEDEVAQEVNREIEAARKNKKQDNKTVLKKPGALLKKVDSLRKEISEELNIDCPDPSKSTTRLSQTSSTTRLSQTSKRKTFPRNPPTPSKNIDTKNKKEIANSILKDKKDEEKHRKIFKNSKPSPNISLIAVKHRDQNTAGIVLSSHVLEGVDIPPVFALQKSTNQIGNY